jgi:hypothetical protein
MAVRNNYDNSTLQNTKTNADESLQIYSNAASQ